MEKELRVLIVAEPSEMEKDLQKVLSAGSHKFGLAQTSYMDDVAGRMAAFHPDLVLAIHSDAIDALEVLDVCQKKKSDASVIVIADGAPQGFAVATLRKGALDYVDKHELSRLPHVIQDAIRLRRQENSRRRHEVLLRHQNAELKKVNRDLEMFVHSTSHNLRAPLRSVLGLIHLSRQELAIHKTENLDQYYGLMENSIHALDDTIRLILDYSRTRQLVEEVEEIDFERMFEEIFNNLEHINSPETIHKEVIVHPGSRFYCSRMKLHLILLNLVSNAIKYYDPEKKQSFVRMQVHRKPDQAVIEIEDNGMGIPTDLQQRVFDMFYRATESSEGSGLGLFIVKETIERLGGSIGLTSAPGIGTTFHLMIPNYVGSATV